MPQPYKIFTIYAREDAQYLEELRGQLRPLEYAGRIKVWSDREINPGVDWEQEIVQNLDTADIILILVSAAYYNSAYIHEKEIKYALSRHEKGETKVLPVIVRPCSFSDDPVISRLQVLPTDGKPVTSHYWRERDDAWLDVVAGVKRTIELMQQAEGQREAEARKQKEEEKRVHEEAALAAEHQRQQEIRREEEAKQRAENERLSQLRRAQEQERLAALDAEARKVKEAEQAAWQQAAGRHDIPTYEHYLARYPQGEYAREAHNKIKELKKNDAKPVSWLYFIVAGIILLSGLWLLPKIFNEEPISNSKGSEINSAPPKSNFNLRSFTPTPFIYTAPTPIGGKLQCVVELGVTGFNSFVIRVDHNKNWKLERAEFGVSLVKENLATENDIKSSLKRFIADIVSYNVSAKDIHFVVSSGAAKEAMTQKISAALKHMGYFVNEVTPQQEAKLSLRSVLPTDYQEKAFVVDIGSSNTTISWLPNGKLVSYGAKYYQDYTSDATVAQDVMAKASQVPINLRGTCFIIGGVSYELAKQVRNGKERYTVLNAPVDYTPDGMKQKSGLNIYQSIADATGCKQFVFDWDANFTIGFLLNL